MNASDVMTSPVFTVGPDTSVRRIAALLLKHRISAVPVLDNGKLAGIVSEADLLHRHEIGTDGARAGSWWLRLVGGEQSVARYIKSHATRARDVMTTHVVCVSPDTPIAEVATLLEKRGIRRLPVVRDGELVGIVSRSNLVQALAAQAKSRDAADHSDGAIRRRLYAELERYPWWRATLSRVVVTDGVVQYFGAVETDDQRQAARIAAENVPGVRKVEDHRVAFPATMWAP